MEIQFTQISFDYLFKHSILASIFKEFLNKFLILEIFKRNLLKTYISDINTIVNIFVHTNILVEYTILKSNRAIVT